MPNRLCRRILLAALCAVAPSLPFTGSLRGQASVLGYHNDPASTGQNLNEQKITPSLVNTNSFGKIFSAAVDGQVYAQPLYVPALPITAGTYAGTTHPTVFVATQHNSVYAIDAVSGAQLWKLSLINTAAGETTVPAATQGNGENVTGSVDINPEIGVTGTPVIDATADANGKRYLYVVAKSRTVVNNVPHYFFKLHAIDIASGAERGDSPVVIAENTSTYDAAANTYSYSYLSGPSVAGTGDGAVNGRVNFSAHREHQRPALTLTGGRVYIAFASHGDNGPYHGWVLGYDAATLALRAVFNTTPNGSDGGIWMSGGRISVDAAGALYVSTGNGTFANNGDQVVGDFDANGLPVKGNYGDSIIKLVADTSTAANPNVNGWGLRVADYFTPFNQRNLSGGDTDLGSGGVLLLPDSVGSAAHPHLLVTTGKEGRIYMVDRDNMGKFRGGITGTGAARAFVTTGDASIQQKPNALVASFGSPAYFNGQFYYAGNSNDVGKAFSIANGVFADTPASVTATGFRGFGPTFSVSASGPATNGVLWGVEKDAGQLRAYGAASFTDLLYTSSQAANNRDQLGNAVKFGVPTVADGHVLIGTSNSAGPSTLIAYGVFGQYAGPPAQPLNLFAQTVSGGEIDLFWNDNADNESGYEVYVSTDPNNFPATPRLTTSADARSCAVNGLQLNTTYHFRVRAINFVGSSAYSNTAATTSGVAPPVNFTNGFTGADAQFTGQGYTTTTPAGTAIAGNVLRVTDAGADGARAVWLNTAQDVRKFTAVFDFQDTNLNGKKATGDGMAFVIQNAGLISKGQGGGNLGYSGIGKSVGIKFDLFASTSTPAESASTTGYYLNGAGPNDTVTPSLPTSSGAIDLVPNGIDFHSGHVFRVVVTYDGTNLSWTITDTATRAAFTSQNYPLNIPLIVGGGTTASNTAYLGFTGGQGGSKAIQDILSLSYTPSLPVGPAAPGALSGVGASATQINLSWTDNASNETGFRVERAPGASGGTFAPVGSVGANTTMFVDATLATNSTYSYRVVATNAGVSSGPSNVVTLTTPVAPTTPSGATPTLVTANEIDFTWVDNSNNETGFRILRSTNNGEYFTLVTLPPNSTSYQDTTVQPGTIYSYHIQAYNAAGYVDFTGFNTTTPSGVNIVASGATAQEGTNLVGTFAVRRPSASGAPLTVNYTIQTGTGQAAYGTRYTLSPAPTTTTTGSVVIPANTTAATITVTPAHDETLVGAQTVTLALAPGNGYSVAGSTAATVTLLDTPLNTWKIAKFGSIAAAQSPQAADTADANNNGVANLVEYALGNDPVAAAGTTNSPRPVLETVDGGTYLTLTFRRPTPAPTDVAYAVESSPSLTAAGTWQAGVMVTGYPVSNNDGTETVKVRAASPVSGSTQGFIRLRVTRP